MILTTPAGKMSRHNSPSISAVTGVVGAGFSTIVLPAITAGPIFQQATSSGKFHAMIPATTPRGLRRTWISPLASSWIVRSAIASVA